MKIRIAGTTQDSIVDGPGLRYVVFAQGCPHHCLGCHNPQTHDPTLGYDKDIDDILKEIDQNPLLDAITISGGEPFMQAEAFIDFVIKVKQRGFPIMIYSGYTYEEILLLGDKERKLLSLCDTLVDGRFDISLKSLSLLYKGSSNQRIINIPLSLSQQQVILQQVNSYGEFI